MNAREFLKRFHLPQLVRISQDLNDAQGPLASPATGNALLAAEAARVASSKQTEVAPASSTVWSECRVGSNAEFAREAGDNQNEQVSRQQHEKSEWTYRPAARQFEAGDQPRRRDDGFGRPPPVPNAGLKAVGLARATARPEEARLVAAGRERPARRSVEFGQGGEASQLGQCRREESIRLAPPSRRPALSKLQLNQPFLLYKAYKKLELCAYVIDQKNELNEKSGDPIYFPQNYPGKCHLVHVCRHSAVGPKVEQRIGK